MFSAEPGAELVAESEGAGQSFDNLAPLKKVKPGTKGSFVTLNFTLSEQQKTQICNKGLQSNETAEVLSLSMANEELSSRELIEEASKFYETKKGNECFLMVKSWDVPLAENLELISDLSCKLPKGKQLHVLPVDCSDPESLKCPSKRHEQVWASKLSRLPGQYPVVVNSLGDACAG